MNEPFLLGLLVFLGVVLLIEGLYLGLRALRRRESERVRRRLRKFVEAHRDDTGASILRTRTLSELPWFDRLLQQLARTRQLTLLIEQANAPYNVGFYLLLAALLGAVATMAALVFKQRAVLALALAPIAAALPFVYLLAKRSTRMAAFERRFPEALELLARAMRAGHSLSSGMKMMADEFGDPIGPEFERTLEEINFGVATPDALRKLTERVPVADLRYFVVAVIVQRETGGNLAEIVEKLATLIRARFVLLGKVQSLSAEGRLSAVVLVLLPIFLGLYLATFQRDYISLLFSDPIGHAMVAGAVVSMALGVVVMHRMVQIKV